LSRGSTSRGRFSLVTLGHLASTRLARRPAPPIESLAAAAWEIAPAEIRVSPRAFFLPGQLERVTGWAFSDEDPRASMGGGNARHAATRAFLLKDVWLLDGALYKDGAYSWLTPRSALLPRLRAEREIERGALYCSAMGNKYFGQWLMDDCATYPLAAAEGLPVTTDQVVNVHTSAYEAWLGMEPQRLHNAFFRELVVFEDFGQNRNKHRRFRGLGERLLSRVRVEDHPGVFILRGGTGERRLLENEMELAERLRDRRGFRIVDPAASDVPAIVAACAGSRTVVGVEGSGLMHGILLLREGGSILTLQPPNRFVKVYKDLADRDGQNFGLVVGLPENSGFHIDPEEVERTLDLFPA
jgi:hypothetical protein